MILFCSVAIEHFVLLADCFPCGQIGGDLRHFLLNIVKDHDNRAGQIAKHGHSGEAPAKEAVDWSGSIFVESENSQSMIR